MITQSQQTPHQAQSDGPRIYVACLAAYNNGHLYGKWIDADQDAKTIQSNITTMLAASPIPNAEEWAIHDCEGFEGADIQEYSGIETVAKLAAFVSEHGELGGKLLANFNGELEDAEAAFDEYAGEHKSLADFAQDLIEQSTKIPENLVNYIDYDAIARDMELNGDVFTIELGFESVHIFWSR
ncbi:MAG: antirestriction protein [Blastopirellula sp.]|nr:MAG: antirestriction protein [Blastopirellula sp.]